MKPVVWYSFLLFGYALASPLASPNLIQRDEIPEEESPSDTAVASTAAATAAGEQPTPAPSLTPSQNSQLIGNVVSAVGGAVSASSASQAQFASAVASAAVAGVSASQAQVAGAIASAAVGGIADACAKDSAGYESTLSVGAKIIQFGSQQPKDVVRSILEEKCPPGSTVCDQLPLAVPVSYHEDGDSVLVGTINAVVTGNWGRDCEARSNPDKAEMARKNFTEMVVQFADSLAQPRDSTVCGPPPTCYSSLGCTAERECHPDKQYWGQNGIRIERSKLQLTDGSLSTTVGGEMQISLQFVKEEDLTCDTFTGGLSTVLTYLPLVGGPLSAFFGNFKSLICGDI